MSCGVGTLAMDFDSANPEAIAWAETQAAQLVVDIAESARGAIRSVIAEGIEGGVAPVDTARILRSTIGLTERDALAVMRQQVKNLAKGMNAQRATKLAEKYAEKLLRHRSIDIAVTETMRASNEGQKQLWKQAQAEGLLTGRERKVCMGADPCPICKPVDGEIVGLDDEFSIGFGPPFHTRCRCAIGMVMV